MRITRLTRPPGTTSAGRRAAIAVALTAMIGAAPLPGVAASAAVNHAALPASPGPGGGGHDDDGGSRRGRELRHGEDDGTSTTSRPREHRSASRSPSATRTGSPAVAPVKPPARPVSRQSEHHGGASQLAAITGLGGLLILAALLAIGGRRLARMRSV